MHVPVKVTKEVLDIVMKTEMDSGALASMKELATKKDETQTKFVTTNLEQTSGTKGFRIIGIMRDINSPKAEPVGYVLYNDAKKEHSAYSVEQVKMILGMYNFVNAKLENNKVVVTDGAETALLQFDAFRNPIGQPTAYILNRTKETMRANSRISQRDIVTFINSRLEVHTLPASALIAAKNEGKLVISNMKVVNSAESGSFLEAKNVTTIPTYEKEVRPTQVKSDAAEEFRKKQLKMRNHASFAQRLVNIFNRCILIKNSPDPHSNYGTYLKVPGISEVYRGLEFVGTKGLAAIIAKEVIPALSLNKNALDFSAALKEVETGMHEDGTAVTAEVITRYIVGTTGITNAFKLNDENKILLCRYLYAFRRVNGLYKCINTYDILKEYNAAHTGYKEAYIVDSQYLLQRTYENMLSSGRYNNMPTWQQAKSIWSTFGLDRDESISDIVARGITKVNRHMIIWPLPFNNNTNFLMRKLSTLPAGCKQFVPLLLHLCSEASLLNEVGSSLKYRKNRILTMLSAWAAACYIVTDGTAEFYDIERLTFSCLNASSKKDINEQWLFSSFDKFATSFKKQIGLVDRSYKGDRTYVEALITDYVRGGGLFFPYYCALNKSTTSENMHWEFLFPGFKNSYAVKSFATATRVSGKNQMKIIAIKPKHRYGMCDTLDRTLRGLGFNVEYDVSYNSKYYNRIQEHKNLKHYSTLSANFSRAAVAQYLGRPYRSADSNYYHAKTTRLVYYVNTHSPMKRNKTHDLY